MMYVNPASTAPGTERLDVSSLIGHAITDTTTTQSSVSWKFDHLRPSSYYSNAESYGVRVFGVDEDTPYAIAGTYTMVGTEVLDLAVRLYDTLTGVYKFDHFLQSFDKNATATLGQYGYGYWQGSLTGMLERGHTYEFDYRTSIETYSTEDTTASATGDISLSFGGNTVPEPTTFVIWSGLAGIGAVMGWRRKRQAG